MNVEMIERLNKALTFRELQACRIIYDEMIFDTAYNPINCLKLAEQHELNKAQLNVAFRFLEVAGFTANRSMGCKGMISKFVDKESFKALVKDITI